MSFADQNIEEILENFIHFGKIVGNRQVRHGSNVADGVSLQEHLKPRTNRILKRSQLSNVVYALILATPQPSWLLPSATPMNHTK